jgi:hypothetical protein
MIEEYARHNGHAGLIRGRIGGVTGDWPRGGGTVRGILAAWAG